MPHTLKDNLCKLPVVISSGLTSPAVQYVSWEHEDVDGTLEHLRQGTPLGGAVDGEKRVPN